jgi:hypothetical protein
MPASPPAGIEISGLAAQPDGWYVQYLDGSALEVVAWGLLFDNTGAIPLVFNPPSGKLLPASVAGSEYVLVHSRTPDSSVTLLENAGEPATGPDINMGGLYSRKSSRVTLSDPGVTFSAVLEGSLDGDEWFQFGATLTAAGVQSEVLQSVHYARARLDSVDGGTVTIRLAWS